MAICSIFKQCRLSLAQLSQSLFLFCIRKHITEENESKSVVKLHVKVKKISRKITRHTIGAKGFNFLQERLDKKGLKEQLSCTYLLLSIHYLVSYTVIICLYLPICASEV